jgi:hypothetical protein
MAARWLGRARAVSWRGVVSASVGAPGVAALGRSGQERAWGSRRRVGVAPDAGSRGSVGRWASGVGRGLRRIGEGLVAWAGRLGRGVCSGKAPGAALG